MEISYNLRYQKSSFSNRLLLDKEGEIVIYSKGFRLKGKGAGDRGELLNFSEIKEFYHKKDRVIFVTFNKEKYILSETGTLFDQMLRDLYKARNEFLMDALFMKGGKLKAEFESNFERLSKFGKQISKGRGKVRLYEKSMIIIPEDQDSFCIHYDFVNFHEFDEMEYLFKVVMDDGNTILISQLGNDYEVFEEKMNTLLGGMYETLVNDFLKEIFPEFHAGTLLNLAYKMKGGKAVSLKDMEKIDKELAGRVEEFVLEDEEYREKIDHIKKNLDAYNTYYSVAKDETSPGGYVKWTLLAIPDKNLVGFAILPRWEEGGAQDKKKPLEMYFYKVIMERGNPADKIEDKLREINQALVVLGFVKDPCYKDKRELRHSPFQYAIRKMPFLRILRKSYAGAAKAKDLNEWKKELKQVEKNAELKK